MESVSVSRETMTSGRQVGYGRIAAGIAVAAVAVGVAALLRRHRLFSADVPRLPARAHELQVTNAPPLQAPPAPAETAATVTAARDLNRAAALLAGSVLADSAVEHYRGAFHNKAMFAPLIVSSLALAVSAHGVADRSEGAHGVRHLTYGTTTLTGIAGGAFHLYNVAKRPGGFDWVNLFYGAPLAAPFAITLSGLLGAMAERIRDTKPATVPTLLGVPAGRATAAVASFGMLGTMSEAWLLHFRGAFHNPFMLLPVTLPPIAALLLAAAAVGTKGRNTGFTRWWLRLTSAMGLAGSGFHAYGVSRNMGGWRNWSQNLLNGPPIPAPPSFTGLALAGLAAVRLMEEHRDA
jgi:hypothetical protein